MKILYAGDSPLGGPANYLLGILKWMKTDCLHLAPAQKLSANHLKGKLDAVILSDYSSDRISGELQRTISKRVREGMGLMMVGGWGSFSGPFGKWKGTEIEKVLPVRCLKNDDRRNFPGGAVLVAKEKNALLNGFSPQNPPMICGLNEVQTKKESKTILEARRLIFRRNRPTLDSHGYPLLVLHSQLKVAALTTDVAPHWCGGLVDWGSQRMKISLNKTIQIEVGDLYVKFLSSMIHWLGNEGVIR
ncbi:MAG: hypothetical protein HYY63_01665 [Elusimicrobia bacterium]|nr:hypothetical protein [Elusimicrobiota bacterium]